MMTSLRTIGARMDSTDESIGLRHVMAHHRWMDPAPSPSLARLAERHGSPETVTARFLWYNTFLMRVRLALAAGLADASTPWEVMEALQVTPRQVLDRFDVCDLLPSGPGFVPGPREACKAAGDAAAFVIDVLGGVNAVVQGLIDALGAEKVIAAVLIIAGIPAELVLEEKPALAARSREIGAMLRTEGYELVALGEVWNNDLRSKLLNEWQIPASAKHLAGGRGEGDAYLGDGLLFGSTGGRIMETRRHGFVTRGIDRFPGALLDLLADDELWSEKGVVLVRIDIGPGVVDLYLTHLYFGTGLAGDVSDYFPHVAPPSNGERRAVRTAQVKELSDFIDQTHRSENVALVCGDFNIDGNGKDPDYGGLDALNALLAHHDLEDRWITPHHKLAGSELPPAGPTGGDFAKMCVPHPGDPRFCSDSETDAKNGYRIDYILLERPRPEHGMTLDLTRVRRRPFPRPATTDGQSTMSDHLGLDCELLATPR